MTADPFLTVDEVATELRCVGETVRRAIAAGRLVAFRDGALIRIRRSALDSYLERQSTGPRKLRRAS